MGHCLPPTREASNQSTSYLHQLSPTPHARSRPEKELAAISSLYQTYSSIQIAAKQTMKEKQEYTLMHFDNQQRNGKFMLKTKTHSHFLRLIVNQHELRIR